MEENDLIKKDELYKELTQKPSRIPSLMLGFRYLGIACWIGWLAIDKGVSRGELLIIRDYALTTQGVSAVLFLLGILFFGSYIIYRLSQFFKK